MQISGINTRNPSVKNTMLTAAALHNLGFRKGNKTGRNIEIHRNGNLVIISPINSQMRPL